MPQKTLLCLGYGYTAKHLATVLAGKAWRIIGTTRSQKKAQQLVQTGVAPLVWEAGADLHLEEPCSAILISTPPGENGCPSLRAISPLLRSLESPPTWIAYLSTNGVYGDHDGDWVNEDSPRLATSIRGRRRIKAEDDWLSLGRDLEIPVKIFRLPGIYGPGRSALDTVRAGNAKRIYKEGQVFNRAHVDDIATVIRASIDQPSEGEIFNIADDDPAPPQDVIAYACDLLGAPVPPLIPIEEANLSEMATSFYRDNKRVYNKRMKELLNADLNYPSYKEGLKAIFSSEKEVSAMHEY